MIRSWLIVLLLCVMPGMAIADNHERPQVVLSTNLGDITVELRPDEAPTSVENFLRYVDNDRYDGLIFHRVIPGFMIQGGGYDTDMEEVSTFEPIENEADNGLENRRGTVAMARTNEIDSATSQFFINLGDNNFLDHSGPSPRNYGYAVFGEVVDGMDVVDEIAGLETTSRGGHSDVPAEPVIIEEARRADPQ